MEYKCERNISDFNYCLPPMCFHYMFCKFLEKDNWLIGLLFPLLDRIIEDKMYFIIMFLTSFNTFNQRNSTMKLLLYIMVSHTSLNNESKKTFKNKNMQNRFEIFSFIILIKNIYKGFYPTQILG